MRARAGASPAPATRPRRAATPAAATRTRGRGALVAAARVDAARSPRAGAARRRTRAGCLLAGARAMTSTRSRCRSWPARCAPPARRWAPCSIRARTRPTSRSAGTARRRCSTPDGAMVMQAEHIPVHLGAMPAAVAAVLDERPRARRVVGPQRPLRRRHPPPRHHRGHPVFARRRSCSASPPAARTTPTSAAASPGSMPADSHDAGRGGRRHRAARRSTTRRSTSSRRGCASPPSAAPTCARSSAPTALGARRLARAGRARRRRRRCTRRSAAVQDYAERRMRACLAALPDGDARGARRARGASTGDLELRPRRDRRRRRGSTLDFTGSAAPGPGQPQLPAGRDARRPAASRCAC